MSGEQGTPEERLARARVTFTIADVTVGDVRDIWARRMVDVVSPRGEEELAASKISQSDSYPEHSFSTTWDWLEARWQSVEPFVGVDTVTLDQWREAELNKSRPGVTWQRYVSYTVAIRYQAISRGPYRAMFLFGHDATGAEVVVPVDTTIGMGGLANALAGQLFPTGLVSTHLRTHSLVAGWLSANAMPQSACPTQLKNGQKDVCCDVVKLVCGPGRDDVSAALAQPLPDAAETAKKGGN